MNKEKIYLNYALGFITIILTLFSLSILVAMTLYLLGIMNINLFGTDWLSLQINSQTSSSLAMFLSLLSGIVMCLVLLVLRQFFKNLLADQIFVPENVTLAKRVSLLLLLASLVGNGVVEVGDYSFFNLTYFLTALVVWTLAKILDKANQIAEENEFTI